MVGRGSTAESSGLGRRTSGASAVSSRAYELLPSHAPPFTPVEASACEDSERRLQEEPGVKAQRAPRAFQREVEVSEVSDERRTCVRNAT